MWLCDRDARGEWQYRAAFDVNSRDASGQAALHIASALGHLPCVSALLDHTAPCAPTDESQVRVSHGWWNL